MGKNSFTLEFDFRNTRYKKAEDGLREFSKIMEQGIDRGAPALSKELRSFLDSVSEALSKRHGGSYPGGTGSNSLSKRSGELIKSIEESVQIRGSKVRDIEGSIGSDKIYARIQEVGGVIKPKNAKYLTIPLPEALNTNGTPKKRSAREWDKTFIIKSKKGNLLIVQKKGRGIVPLYVLKKKVVIPPRLNMGKTLDAGLPYFVDKAMESMVKAILNK